MHRKKVLGFEIPALVLDSNKVGVLGYRCLGIKAADVADLSEVQIASAGDRSKQRGIFLLSPFFGTSDDARM